MSSNNNIFGRKLNNLRTFSLVKDGNIFVVDGSPDEKEIYIGEYTYSDNGTQKENRYLCQRITGYPVITFNYDSTIHNILTSELEDLQTLINGLNLEQLFDGTIDPVMEEGDPE